MTNRVLLNESAFKVSVPGADVLTASGLDLLFTSDASQLDVYIQGSYLWSGTGDGSGTLLSFSKTFSGVPIAWFAVTIFNNSSESTRLSSVGTGSICVNTVSGAARWLQVEIRKNGIYYDRYNYDPYNRAQIDYIVFDYNS